MTRQLFSDLNDLAAEQVMGGFKTAKIEVTYNYEMVDHDNDETTADVEVAVSVASVSWNGLWNENKKGKAKITDGVSNNVYSDGFDGDGGIFYWDEFGQQWTGTANGEFTVVGG